MNASPSRDFLAGRGQADYRSIPVYVQSIYSVYSVSVEVIEVVISEARLIDAGKSSRE